MLRILLLTLLLLAGLALPQPAAASCDGGIETRSRYLSFIYYETYPLTETSEGLLSSYWERIARGLATAVNCQRRIETDTRLSKMLAATPISLTSLFGRPVQATSDISPEEPAPSDSIVALFRGLDRDSSAELFTVLVGSFSRKSGGESFMMDLGYSPDDEEAGSDGSDSDPGMDTTMVMDIVYSDCIQEFDRPDLFLLPPELTPDKGYWVLSGIYYAKADAQRSVGKHQLPGTARAQVKRLRFTGRVLRSAFPRS